MRRFLILFCFLFVLNFITKSQTNYSFRTINKDNGLLDNFVEQVYEDSRGFMWFATHGGLARYDGHSFENYQLPKDKNSDQLGIARNFINSVIEDNNHHLWIGTLAGVYIYDLQKCSYQILEKGFNDVKLLQHRLINEIVFDKSFNAWIATRTGLTFFDKTKNICTHFLPNSKDKTCISSLYINAICVDYKGDVWFGTREGGLEKLAADKKTFIHYKDLSKGIDDINIQSVFEDSKKNLWALSSQKGLFCKSYGTEMFKKVPLIINLTNKEFLSLFVKLNEDVYGNIWVSTMTDGIVIYNPETQSCIFINENTRYPQNICGNSVQNISRDKQGNMWLSTHGGGVSVFNPKKAWFSYFSKSQTPNSLPGNIVSCFNEDHNGTVWIGTDGNGFARFIKQNGTFESYSKINGLSSNAVLDICEIKDNVLAIGTYAGGLNIFDVTHKTFKQYRFQSARSDANLQNIFGFHFDKTKQLLWCCAFADGIQIFDCAKMKFLLPNELEILCPYYKVPVFSLKMIEDKEKTVWVTEGVQFYKFKDNKTYTFDHSDSSKNITNMSFAMDLLEDSKGSLWVNTTKGVTRFDKKNNCFRLFQFPNVDLTEANGLLEDSYTNIWISTSRSLFRYSQNENKIENISEMWGMPKMQYVKKSTMRGRDGFLYFGGLNGFVMLDENAKNPIIEPSLYITKLIINDDEQSASEKGSVLQKDISYVKNITLPYDRNYITIEFAAMNFVDNEKSKFKYLLKGFNDTWIETASDRQAQFTSIPPGEYTFLLKTTNSNGNWIEKPLKLTITILPPWWKTLWFRFILLVLLLIVIWQIINIREASIKRKNKQLEALVAERTIDLQQQKTTIQSQYDSIKENHFVIELKNSQLQDALEMKDKLLTVIAHDFKNPLTSLQGMLKVIQKKVNEKGLSDIKKNVDSVVVSSTKLMDQMVSILDWTLGNDKTIIHVPIDTNLENVVADVLTLVSESASRKSITLSSKSICKSTAWVDPRMITAVIRNVVINSIKYTEDDGKIWVRILEDEQDVICEIEDTGIGMEQEYIDKIMSTTDLVAENYQTGFGIMICKTFITRNKGRLQISSTINKGTTFRIYLPKGNPILANNTTIKPEEIEQIVEKANAEVSMLIIDDNKDIIGFLGEEFADNYSVYGAYDGKKGLQIAHNVVPDIILCDVNMPIIDGLTFCKMIKSDSLTSHIPIILISAKSLQIDQIEGLKSGADDYVTKPFDIGILKQKVNTIITNRQILTNTFKALKSTAEVGNLPESYSDKITNEATALILANLNNANFSVDELAKQLCLSRSQLYRKFVSVIGQTPKEYILTIKFQKAIEMLKTKKYRIADIAYELGFTDSHYFSICFTQRFGVSPTNYFPKENNS
jgi:ligand-binding sensor domain-containing protein/signal transduction histidine kinase/DNA-binding response OmpR family regulator